MKEFMRRLNLNSKEMDYKIHVFIYSLCTPVVAGFPKPFTRCLTPHLEVRHI